MRELLTVSVEFSMRNKLKISILANLLQLALIIFLGFGIIFIENGTDGRERITNKKLRFLNSITKEYLGIDQIDDIASRNFSGLKVKRNKNSIEIENIVVEHDSSSNAVSRIYISGR